MGKTGFNIFGLTTTFIVLVLLFLNNCFSFKCFEGLDTVGREVASIDKDLAKAIDLVFKNCDWVVYKQNHEKKQR